MFIAPKKYEWNTNTKFQIQIQIIQTQIQGSFHNSDHSNSSRQFCSLLQRLQMDYKKQTIQIQRGALGERLTTPYGSKALR